MNISRHDFKVTYHIIYQTT